MANSDDESVTVDTVEATYVGPFEASLPDGTPLIPGETVVEIPRGEAEESDNWQPKGRKKASKPKGPTKAEILAELEEKGIVHDPAGKKSDLEDLLADPDAPKVGEANIPGEGQTQNPNPEDGN